VPAGVLPTLRWAWIATSKMYTLDFINASKTTITIDGMTFSDLEEYWGAVIYSEEDGCYISLWISEVPTLAAGENLVEFSLSLDRAVTDGYDVNGDGKEDQYGPGETFSGWVGGKHRVRNRGNTRGLPEWCTSWALGVDRDQGLSWRWHDHHRW